MKIETKMFKGKPVIGFYANPDRDFPTLSFGLGKAKIILENIDVIREFVKANDQKPVETVVAE
jgi:hypothetical protein